MSVIGTVDSVWRYPVKSMRGEELAEIYAGYGGVYGDRLFAFKSAANPEGFPWLTGRDKRQMLLYRPRFRDPDKAARPVNQSAAEGNNAKPIFADAAELMVDVEMPDGNTIAIDDPSLIQLLRRDIDPKHEVTLLRSDSAMTDCRPISLISIQTARKLGQETGLDVDKRRFRANIYIDLSSSEWEDEKLVGRNIRLGSNVTIAVLERDARCMMITLDPNTAEKTPAILKQVAQAHEGTAGVYAAVLIPGTVRPGDSVDLLDS